MLRHSIDTLQSRPQLYRAKLGVYLLIVSLAVFFLASLVAYAVIRTALSIEMKPLVVPISFIVSTAFLIANSVVLHFAVLAVRGERQDQFHKLLYASFALSVVFLALQCIGMGQLIETHFSVQKGFGKLYGISFTLAFVHAAHVLGGVVFLIYVAAQMKKNRYDHERHWTVDICATYWHFLDVVWIVMLATFWFTESALAA
ncbi:cytochrome c oxidase subunit 3 [Mariniblastus sp.]|jgi:cytochrome c oxidase subunit III|nr:cytochrome c oxidase subunit 3 [Mariniblastus sp.]MDB4756560.1 cytochrome c oxidase subunit 3 [Mariniblastus sp.]